MNLPDHRDPHREVLRGDAEAGGVGQRSERRGLEGEALEPVGRQRLGLVCVHAY